MNLTHSEYLSDIESVVEDARKGRMVILVDDEDRENEGDLVIPAEMATPQAITFMATHGRGLICLARTEERPVELEGRAAIAAVRERRLAVAFVRVEERKRLAVAMRYG